MENLEDINVPVAAHNAEVLPIDPIVQDEVEKVALEVEAKINQ